MYDYVTREIPLTPEEQEKAKAILELAERAQLRVAHGEPPHVRGVEERAFLAFKDKFYKDVQRRLARPTELDGGGIISEDGTKIIICQVKLVGDREKSE